MLGLTPACLESSGMVYFIWESTRILTSFVYLILAWNRSSELMPEPNWTFLLQSLLGLVRNKNNDIIRKTSSVSKRCITLQSIGGSGREIKSSYNIFWPFLFHTFLCAIIKREDTYEEYRSMNSTWKCNK